MSLSTHWFWILSRAAGTTALVLSAVAISFGLVSAGRMRRSGGADRRTLHEALAWSTMVAIALHALLLLGDPFLHPGLADVTVPLVSSYERVATSLGIVAGWMTVAIGLGFYARRRVGARRYRTIHRLTVLAWALGLVHTFLEGTDAGQAWFIAIVAISSAPVVILLGRRLLGLGLPIGPVPGSRAGVRTRTG